MALFPMPPLACLRALEASARYPGFARAGWSQRGVVTTAVQVINHEAHVKTS
jgi:hypothetical protein